MPNDKSIILVAYFWIYLNNISKGKDLLDEV